MADDISRRAASFTVCVLLDLVYACENYGIPKQEIEQRMRDIVSLLSLNSIIERKLSDLSGGEKQKIAIASILMLKTDILLLDEPSSNLDYQSIILLSEVFEKLKASGYTIIVIEHRLFYIKNLCDRLIVMEHGKISGVYEKSELKTMNNRPEIGSKPTAEARLRTVRPTATGAPARFSQ